ncbi:calcium-activated chloride channel regulator 1-like isoform X2 [Ornithodoros turicata]
MSTWQLVVFAALLASGVWSASTRIRLENQGYVDIVVTIDHQVREDKQLIQNLKDLLTSTSAFLHRATRELVYLKSVTIVLPHTWSNDIPSEFISGDMFSSADIQIVNSQERAPYTVQAKGCGERGEYIVLPSQFVGNLTTATKKEFRKPEQVMTHEWAHFRYGVFDEFGSPGDAQYPSMYVRDGQKKPNVCSDKIAVSLQTDKGEPCDLVEGSPQEDCIDFSPVDEFTQASSSIMFMPVLSSVYTFCDDDEHKHNAEAPNPQNALCDSRSTWDVISHNSDFNGIDNPVTLEPTTFRVLKAHVKQRCVLVLDTSTSMMLKNRLEIMHRAAARYIQDLVPDGTELGIVVFNTNATINAYLTEINRNTRAALISKLPRTTDGITAIGKGLLEGVKVLEQNATSIENSVIILMSDGEENVPPLIRVVMPELLKKGVIVHTLALGYDADKGLEALALATGGRSYAVTNEKTFVLENLEKAFFSASTAQRPIEQKPVTLVNKVIPLEGNTTSLFVTVDRELGKNLEFLASGGDGATMTVIAKSPSGNTYIGKYDKDLKRHKVYVGDIVEPGKWQVDIKHDNPSSNESVSITVVSEAKDPQDPPVRMRTFYSTTDLSYARASTQFKIFVELKKGEQVVKGAHVVATVTTPRGDQVPVVLKDNGAGADIVGGDGIYSGFFANFSSSGRYSVEVQAYGDENTNLIAPKRPSGSTSGGHKARRSVEPFAFERYENAGVFVVKHVEPALVYPPSPIRDLRVEQALYLDNGTRAVSLKWTSPGAHLDEGTCHNLTIMASRDRTVLQREGTTGDFYRVTEYDVVNGTLRPLQSGEPHEVTFLIPDTWLPPNKSAHDVYFTVSTWNSDGIKSNRSNIATANFFEQSEKIVVPSTIRDLRVEQALYLDNGTRAVSLTWTSPGARLDEGTCHNLTITVSCNRTVLQTRDMPGDFYTVTDYDVLNGTLRPQHSGESHKVTFLIPDSWLPPNKSAHDVYFTVSTWNSDGIRSNRSNIATANFEMVVVEKELNIWEKILESKAALYGVSALLVGVLFAVVVLLVINIFAKKSSSSKGMERVAVFRAAPAKYEVEKACT